MEYIHMESGAQPRDNASSRLIMERLCAHFVPAVCKVSDDVAHDAVIYFQFVIRFHSTHVDVILFTPIRKDGLLYADFR
jgi:hypothetical protein